MPSMMFTRVDLPAPFSPARAWISPRFSSKSTPRRARIGPNDFDSFRMLRTGSSAGRAGISSSMRKQCPRTGIACAISVRIAAFHVLVEVEGVGVFLRDHGEAIVDEGNLHRVVARDLVIVERIEHVRMGRHEGGDEAHEPLHALVGIKR